MIFKHTFSGTDYYYAIRSGARGWILIDVGVDPATVINSALSHADTHDVLVLLLEDWTITSTLSVLAGVHLHGVGWKYALNYDAGGNCIAIVGDDAKISDLKINIVAGAGAAGTRPNCIHASGVTNLEIVDNWLIGDDTVGDDGTAMRQCGIVFDSVTESRIALCRSEDNKRHGFRFASASNIVVMGNIVQGNTRMGMDFDLCNYMSIVENIALGNLQRGIILYRSDNSLVTGNICQGNMQHGIHLNTADNNTVVGNTSQGNTERGINLEQCINNTLVGNTCLENITHGIYIFFHSNNNTVVGNTSQGNTENGIYIYNDCSNNTVEGNTCQANGFHGIRLYYIANDNTITGNTCNGNDSGDTGTYDGISIDTANGNLILGNTCKDNDRWGIMVNASSDYNKVSMNYTSGNTSGSIRVNNANCDNNQIEFNTVEEGAPSNAGTNTRSYGNYDPSANAFVGDVGAAPF